MAGGPSGPRTLGDSCWDSAGQKKRLAGALICADYDESMGYKIDMNIQNPEPLDPKRTGTSRQHGKSHISPGRMT